MNGQQVEQFQRDIDQWDELTQTAQLKGFTPESEALLLQREYQLWEMVQLHPDDGLAADLVRCGIPLPEAAAHAFNALLLSAIQTVNLAMQYHPGCGSGKLADVVSVLKSERI